VVAVPASATGGLASYQAVFFAKNISGASSNTVTASFDRTVTGVSLEILEYHGIDINSPIDVATGNWGTGTTADSGWVTTNNGNELLLAITTSPGGGILPGPGYTIRAGGSGGGTAIEDQFVSSPGAYHGVAAVAPGSYWITHLFALNLLGGGSNNTQGLTPPSNLMATAISGTSVTLSWMGSTDNMGGVTGYLVERCAGTGCSNFTQIANVTSGTTYTDTTLTPSIGYTYRVRATDVAGLLSSYAPAASAMAAP
jgi:hypothetical protein